eukprot:jgi/Mesvir1/19301/Mv10371-RA.2
MGTLGEPLGSVCPPPWDRGHVDGHAGTLSSTGQRMGAAGFDRYGRQVSLGHVTGADARDAVNTLHLPGGETRDRVGGGSKGSEWRDGKNEKGYSIDGNSGARDGVFGANYNSSNAQNGDSANDTTELADAGLLAFPEGPGSPPSKSWAGKAWSKAAAKAAATNVWSNLAKAGADGSSDSSPGGYPGTLGGTAGPLRVNTWMDGGSDKGATVGAGVAAAAGGGAARKPPAIVTKAASWRGAAGQGGAARGKKKRKGAVVRFNLKEEGAFHRVLARLHTIHPDSPFAKRWSMFVLLMLTHETWAFPFRVALGRYASTSMPIEAAVDALFLVDMLILCNTAYYNEFGVLMNKHRDICRRYMAPSVEWISANRIRGQFYADMLALVPMYIAYAAGVGPLAYTLITLPRLSRIIRLQGFFRMMERDVHVNVRHLALYKFTLLVYGAAHWVGCLYYLLARLNGFNRSTWIGQWERIGRTGYEEDTADNLEKYVLIIYKGFNAVSNLGFEIIVHTEWVEMLARSSCTVTSWVPSSTTWSRRTPTRRLTACACVRWITTVTRGSYRSGSGTACRGTSSSSITRTASSTRALSRGSPARY